MGIIKSLLRRDTRALEFCPPPSLLDMKFDPRYLNTFTDAEKALITEHSHGSGAYVNVLTANVCIRILSDETANLFRAVRLQKAATRDVVERNPIENKLFNSPNSIESGFELHRRVITEYILSGNGYYYVIGTPPALPINIDPLFSRTVRPEPGNSANGEPYILRYEYTDENGNPSTYEPEEIIHVKSYNPSSRIEGLSWLSAMAQELEMAGDINEYQATNIKEGFFPAMALTRAPDAGPMDEPGRTALRSELYNKKIGPGGERYIILDNMKIEKLSFSPADMEILKSEQFTAAMIATGLKVPAELLGPLMDKKNVATYREAQKQLYDLACIPLLQEYLDKFNSYFFQDGGMEFVISKYNIGVFQKDATELSTMWWVSGNEKRRMQGHAMVEDEMMDKILVPSGMILLDDLGVKEDEEAL